LDDCSRAGRAKARAEQRCIDKFNASAKPPTHSGSALIVNVVLAVFNLLPLPPLDGEQIAVGLLPDLLASPLARLEPYGAATYKRLALQEELLRGDRSALRQKTIEAVSRLSWRLVDFSWPARVA
jgi:peptidase M50-like protein